MASLEELLQCLPKSIEQDQRLVPRHDQTPVFGVESNNDSFDDAMFNSDFDIFDNRLLLDDDVFQMKHLNQLTSLELPLNDGLNAQSLASAKPSHTTLASLWNAAGNKNQWMRNKERKKVIKPRKARNYPLDPVKDEMSIKLKSCSKMEGDIKPSLRRSISESENEKIKSKHPRSIHPQLGRPRYIPGLTDDPERQKRQEHRTERRAVQRIWSEGVTSYPIQNFRTNECIPFPYAHVDECTLFRRYHTLVDHFSFVQNFVALEIQSNHCSLSRIVTGEYPYQTKPKYVRRFRTWLFRVDQSIATDLAAHAAWKGDENPVAIAAQVKVDPKEMQEWFDCTLELGKRSQIESKLLAFYREFLYEQKCMNLPIANPVHPPTKNSQNTRRDHEDEAILNIFLQEAHKLHQTANSLSSNCP
jgi:hypothetical protein